MRHKAKALGFGINSNECLNNCHIEFPQKFLLPLFFQFVNLINCLNQAPEHLPEHSLEPEPSRALKRLQPRSNLVAMFF
jgi:hypothetical protein